MSIPVQNLYHLLTYAWDQLKEAEAVAVAAEPADTLLDLLARVLVQGTTHVLKRGLARDYVPETELTGRVRGKLLLSDSIRQQTLPTARAWCSFDELSHDVPINRLLKATLHQLLTAAQLDDKLRREVRALYIRLADVSLISVRDVRVFDQVLLHRHNAHYRLLLSICRLVHEEALLTQETGKYLFSDFTGNEKRMAALFERFVRNFYRLRQQHFSVKAEKLDWHLTPDSSAAKALLPGMQTDVSLTAADRKIIIDCKYYQEALKKHYDKEKLISGHLYQLYAYVQHARCQQATRPVRGMLLYPVTHQPLRLQYQLTGTLASLEVATLDLGQHWTKVEKDLLSLL
ncbi:5-methylcytosine-specific restriction endonuclease system specificity protein McrC [Hymenobacter edaphi]|uniref:5-methylcytosine-specific restriction endonuclease system specificity protein McrC n=1 Tax=Hymenobacter edaphi TaxID=2211146 RepID=A0A328B3J9_9BACT|nr:5-methylcytosine-specific restriction endonuclease system specificity protein McrC [Hymenobacter edaphi]RAK62012.1 5-methylcytosine-specific restriction endonuclease system specificity protein McrC [Hymenobacter edaphi]